VGFLLPLGHANFGFELAHLVRRRRRRVKN
jgi:hypothetical protein